MINFLFGLLTKPTYQLNFLEQVIVLIVYIANLDVLNVVKQGKSLCMKKKLDYI